MAYATKYLFKWQSAKGTTREIRVLKNGYSGSVIQRALGRAPILKKQKNGTVFGTSLEFYAECQVEGEFTEFYTTNPKAYKVQLYAGNDLLWQGYVTPELYSEPDIAPPFDVQVIATDGIGELKLYDFEPQGTVTLRSIFTYLLGYTGLGTDVYLISSLKAGSSGAGALLEKTINLDYMAGESCYDVLTYLLDTLHATITWWKGAWIVARETNVSFTSGKVRYLNTAGNSALLAGSVQTLGKMYTNDVWPVGQLSRKVDPAKKSVTVQAPWHVVTAFVNSGMDSDSGWTKANNASFDSTKGAYYLPDNDPYQPNGLAEISQQISMLGLRVPMSFSGKFCATELPPFSGATYGGVVGVDVLYVTGNVSYYLTKDDNGDTVWKQGDGGKYDFQIRLSQVNTDEAGAEELTFEVPPLMLNNTYPSGTLTFHIVGRSALVFNAFLDIKISKGYQDRLHIDNGARGEEGEYEVAIGRETSDIDYYKAFMQGILLDSGSLITSFKDDAITTGMDFLAFISRDYARSFALPRIVRTGTVQLEAAVQFPPLVLTKAAVDYWLETWSWNMYEDELDITARSLPTASITVDSEVISEASGTTSGGSGSGGGSSSMSGGGSNYFEPDDEVESAVALKAAYIAISAPDFLIGPDRESVTGDLDIIGAALQSLQAQIDSVASRDCFDELSATTFYAGMVASPDARFHEAHAARYYLTDSIYMEYVPGAGGNAGYVKLNAALVTSGDQIVNSGTPGGGGGGGIGYLYQAYDVSGSISVKPSARKLLVFNPEGTDKNGEAGAWEYEDIPEQAVTSVALSAGASNGTIHLVVNNVAQSDVAVKGLGSAAFQNTDAFAAAIHTHAISDVSGLNDNLLTISGALQSLQCQIDSVSARDCFDDLTASTIATDIIATTSAHAERYYLTDNIYFSIVTVNGTACVKLNAPFVTTGDQIILDGTPAGGGGAGSSYLYELLDVSDALRSPSKGTMMYWDGNGEWIGSSLDSLADRDVLIWDSSLGWKNVPANTIGGVTSVSLASGASNGTIHLVVNGAAQADVAVTGLDAAAFRGVASAIGSGVTGLVDGALLCGVLGDAFDSTNTVKAFVNSSIATATATFRGTNTTATTESAFLTWANGLTHDLNDYVFWKTTDSVGNTVFKRYKYDGSQWSFEYELNNSSFTAEQWAAINSGITSTKVIRHDTVAGYFGGANNDILSVSHGGTGLNTLTSGKVLIGAGTSAVTFADAWVKVGTTQISLGGQQTSLAGLVDVTMSGKLKIGDATIEWVPNSGNGYLKIDKPLVTEGDQIVNSGTPGGGSGGGAGYLYELGDVYAASDKVLRADGTNRQAGDILAFNASHDWVALPQSSLEVEISQVTGLQSALDGKVDDSDINDMATKTWVRQQGYVTSSGVTNITTGAGLDGGPITSTGTISISSAYQTYISHGETAYGWGDALDAAIKSLQCQIDSVSARDCFDDLTASTIFADTLAASGAYIGEIAGHLTGNVEGTATNATYLVGSTFSKGGAATPVYFTGGQPAACSYSFGNASGNASLNNGSLNVNLYAYRAQIDSDSENIASNMSTIGGCLKSIQAQIDSVASRDCFDELYATAFSADQIAATSAFIETVTGDLTGTASRAKADADGNTISSTYLKLSGGTMSGVLLLKANQYSGPSGNYGMNANNSDIVGLNAIYTEDLADDMAEGINFFRSSGHWDSLTSSNGVLYYYPNRPDATTAFANAYTIYHSGNANKSDVPWTCQYLTVNASPQTTYRAYVNGDIVSSGDQVITSDATKKKNWREVGYGVEDIARCTVGRFDWIDGHGTSVGTKAQDWRPLTPELVHGEEGDLNLAYGQIALVNTILIARHESEQDKEIHRLRELVNELENEVRRLRS